MIQAVNRVSCESGDGLGNDVVNIPCEAVVDHLLELRAFVRPGSGDAFVRVNALWTIPQVLKTAYPLHLQVHAAIIPYCFE